MNNAYLPYVVTEAFCIVYTVTIFVCLQSKVGEARELERAARMAGGKPTEDGDDQYA